MNVLIVYGTTEGQTRKIAAWTATHIRERGHQVELQDSAALASDLKLGAFHAFIIAASVHQEHHQETVTNFVFAHHELLNASLQPSYPSVCRRRWKTKRRKRKSTWIASSLEGGNHA